MKRSASLLSLLLILSVVFVVLLILASVVPFVAALSFFYRTYEGMGTGKAYSVVQTSDGGYALAGITESFDDGGRDFWLVKTDSDGNMEWNKTYGGTKDDFAHSVVQTSDGGYAMEGYTNSFGAGGYDFWLVKTDSLGNMEWNQTYGGPSDDHAFSMVQTADGGYVLVGETESFGAKFTDFLLVKTDSFGKMEWNKTYDAIAGRDYAPYVIQAGDGGYALVGRTQSSVVEGYDCWLIKTDSFGNIEWNKTFRVVGDPHPNSIVQTGDGGYAIAGGPEYWLVKTDSSGNTEWNKTFTLSPKGDWCHCMIQTKDGSYLLVGTKSYNLMALTKTDSSGNLLWNQTYGYGAINSVIQTSDGGYALAGYNFHQGINFCLIKTDEVGIIPEFPSLIVLPMAMIVILIVTVLRRRGARATNSCPMTTASKRFIAALTIKKLKKISLVSLLITTTLILSSATIHAVEVTATITLENPGGYYGIAYDSGKSEIFLTNVDFDLVSVISDSTNAVVANIPVGSQPVGIAYDSAKGELFVANYASDSISVIADGTNTVVANIPVGSQPFAVAYDSGKGEIFVTNYNSSSVSVISDSTHTVVANITVGSQPCALAYDSGKGEIFVGHAGCNQVLVISDSTNAIVANVTMEDQPVSLAYDSGKGEIFVANYNSSSVSVISDSTNLIVATVNVGANPIGLAYDSGNGQIFVANYNSNSVSVISDSTNTVIENVTLENQPQGICYDSGKGEIFVTYSESNRVSVISDSSLPLPSPSIPEFPAWTPLLIMMVAVVAVILVYRNKLKKHNRGSF